MTSYSCSNFSWGKRPCLMLFLCFPRCLVHVGHPSSNTGLINGWEILIVLTVYTSKNRELPFIFVVFDQYLLPVLPDYRKNSVWSRKLVLWIHISFVGQWSSCMWHDFCWHIVYSFFSFFFFSMSEEDYFHSSHKWWRVVLVSLWPWESHFTTFNCSFLFYNFSSSSVQWFYGFVAAQLFSHLIEQICFYEKGKNSLVPSSFSALALILMDGATDVNNRWPGLAFSL